VELTGLPGAPDMNALTGIVFHSDAPITGSFECSNPVLNQIFANTLWGQRGNHHGIPTDCPQRDERLGWMGDAQIFAQTAIFNMGMGPFYTKWIQDIRDAQRSNGAYPDVVPIFATSGWDMAPAWADAGVMVPWSLYLNYGDVRIIEEHFASAKKFIDLVSSSNPNNLWINNVGNNYSDWLNGSSVNFSGYPSGGAVPKEVFSTAFFYHSTSIVAKMAAILGMTTETEQYQNLAENIRFAFNTSYVNDQGEVQGNSQSGYALALNFDLLEDHVRPLAAQHMQDIIIDDYDTRISTGFNTTLRLMVELSRWGHNEIAYALAESERFPSWGYSIAQGATTIWERWDGWVEGRGFQDAGMNSFNHYSFGSVMEWMYRVILGINFDENQPGYKHIRLNPQPGGSLTWAKGSYHSLYGDIISDWKKEADGTFTWNVTIPANTTADICVPKIDYSSSDWTIQEKQGLCWQNGAMVFNTPGISLGWEEDTYIILQAGSGEYSFHAGPDALVLVNSRNYHCKLSQNVPNPFSRLTAISYDISGSVHDTAPVKLQVFDIRGNLINTVVDGPKKAGVYTTQWDGNDSRGNAVPPGTYFYRLQAGDSFDMKRKMVKI
jgi:alpha-L-rhamnosidase